MLGKLPFYLFSPTRLINSMKHEHSCKILCLLFPPLFQSELWPFFISVLANAKIVSEYDQEIPQSQTADNPVAPRGRAAQPSRDTRKTN